MSFGIGQPVLRTEDPRLLTGRGTFVDDIAVPHMAYMAVVYATVAHAHIKSIATSDAEAAPGVLAVLTGKDVVADGLGGIPPAFMPEDMGGPPGFRTECPILAAGRVRHVGERVAIVVAETPEMAAEAAELVAVEYDTLPVVVRAADAIADGAPQVHEGAANNTSFTLRFGDAAATDAAFQGAAHVVSVDLYNNRITTCSMEPRGAIGDYRAMDDAYVLNSSIQAPHNTRTTLARDIFHEPEAKFRVIAGDVGGGFGLKGQLHPEEALVLWASKRIGRPVKWISDRTEAFLGDNQARDQTAHGELALDADGKFLALRVRAMHNAGAYIVGSACVPIAFSLRMAPSVYAIPAIDVMSHMVLTNTAPTVPYRGAGRPEAIYMIERLVDKAARALGMDRVELRRKNYLTPEDMPHHTATHFVYDSGEFDNATDKCLQLADADGFEARRAASEKAGLRRGMGVSYYIDDCGIFNERMDLRFDASGSLTIEAGTFSHGQGHQTTYAQMISDWLGVPFETIRFEQGDTARIGIGRGTYASRSMTIGGSALRRAADDLLERGKKLAAHMLEAATDDIEFADGIYKVAGTDKAIPLIEVAKFSYHPMAVPIEFGVGLEGSGAFDGHHPSFPNGCHICEVEIDPDTGQVRIDRYAVVDDIGVVLNPLLAEGQIHGGIVQGIGQALLEDIYHDEDGQLLTGSYMDYATPRADDISSIVTEWHSVLCQSNPIGVKGVGEGGTVGATPTVINAILDALAPLGVTDMGLPATPQRVWRAIRNAAPQTGSTQNGAD
jgi:carbon-monoxide dehydrogenase large subunit